MQKILQITVLIFSIFFLTACFDLFAQSKSIEVEQDSVENKISLGPSRTSDGDTVFYTITTHPSHGTLDESVLPVAAYRPDAGYAGKDFFAFTLSDGDDVSNVATISVFVKKKITENREPSARIVVEGEAVVSEGDRVVLSATGSSDADGSIVSYEWIEGDMFLYKGLVYSTVLSPGSHTIVLKVMDDQNATSEDSVEIVVTPLIAD